MFEIEETARHLYNLLLEAKLGPEGISITKNEIVFYDKELKSSEIDVAEGPTLLSNLLNNVGVNPEICIDCFTEENMKNNEFFEFQMKAYAQFLMLKYGPMVSISRDMACYFVEHELLEDCVIYMGMSGERLTKKNISDTYPGEGKFILTYDKAAAFNTLP